MSKLTFAEFSRANEARKKQFFKEASEMWSISDAFMAAAGEMGEVAEALLFLAAMRHLGEAGNALKKVRRAELGMLNKNADDRQIDNMEQAKAKVAGEIGGFMCYLDQLCVQIGLRLEDCITDEFNKKSVELDLPERISDGVFMLAMKGKIRIGQGGEMEGELLYDPPQPRPISMTLESDMSVDDIYAALAPQMGRTAEQFAAEVERAKYRAAWPEVNRMWQHLEDEAAARVLEDGKIERRTGDRRVGKHPGLGMPYSEQPFNERRIVGGRVLRIPAEELRSQHSFSYRLGNTDIDRLEIQCVDRGISPEVRVYNFDDPVHLENGRTYIFGVDKNDQPFCRPLDSDKPDRPTTWTDGCGKCRWCSMDMDMDPYCTNPEIKKAAGATVGIGLNAAVQTCTKDGKLSLFEPRS